METTISFTASTPEEVAKLKLFLEASPSILHGDATVIPAAHVTTLKSDDLPASRPIEPGEFENPQNFGTPAPTLSPDAEPSRTDDAGQPTTSVLPAAAPLQASVEVPASNPAHVEGDLDIHGVPWSADHHAGTKSTKKDGAWKRKKGGDKDACDAYEARFLVNEPVAPVPVPVAPAPAPTPAALPAAAPAAVAPEVAAIPVTPEAGQPTAPAAVPVAAPGAPAAAPAAAAPAPEAAAPGGEFTPEYYSLCERLSEIVKAGVSCGPLGWTEESRAIDVTQPPGNIINEITHLYGVQGFGDLANHPDQWTSIAQAIEAAWPRTA